MTPKQVERVKKKIKNIKAALAADKKHWGGYYHDGYGHRYSPPKFYIQIGDFTGGIRYMNWFKKNFPDDGCYPEFFFEWTIILFKTKRLKEAEKKAFRTFTSNSYLFDKFFDHPINPKAKWRSLNLDTAVFGIEDFEYSHKQDNLTDFAEWLSNLIQTEKFVYFMNKHAEILNRLNDEHDVDTRGSLLDQAWQLRDEF